jgi:transglutaminase/protease-like cytokinesis protein 3
VSRFLIIILLLLPAIGFTQAKKIDLYRVDQDVENIKSTSPASLAQKLTSPYTTEIEKTRAIFRWISDNITYKTRDFTRRPSQDVRNKLLDDDTSPIKPLNERVADDVLENGTAVCDGYARLFKTLCDYAGITSEIITGYARGSKGTRRFGSNHTWNAVYIDSSWQLMDITWACGYMSMYGDRFIQEFDENYFMTPPAKFIEEHYPDNLQWTLMTDPPLMAEFRNSPYKQKTFSKYGIRSYYPSKGLLEMNEGDSLIFLLESNDISRDHNIFSDLFPDSSVYKTENSLLLHPSYEAGNKTVYHFQALAPEIKWIYLLYNEDVILRYRVDIRKNKSLASAD